MLKFTTLDKADCLIVIDFSNLAYAQLYASLYANDIKDPRNADFEGYKAHLLFFYRKLRSVVTILREKNTALVFAKDNTPVAKFEIFSDYKGQRDDFLKSFNFRSEILEFVRYIDCYIAESKNQEADDVIATLAKKYKDRELYIVGRDKDLWQTMKYKNIRIYDFTKDKIIKEEDIHKVYGFTNPSFIKLHKAFWGDSSDNIPNVVPRMQRQLMPLIEKTNGTLKDFWLKYDEKEVNSRCKTLLDSNREKIEINYKLAKLQWNLPLEFSKYEANPGELKSFLTEKGLHSLLHDKVFL